MLTLSQATAKTRKFIKFLTIFIASALVIILIVRGLIALKEIIAPTPLPPPTVSFGKLPKISFPESKTSKKLKYSINTISGTLPAFPDRAVANKMVDYAPNILDVDNAHRKARNVGFSGRGVKLSDENYRWTEPSTLKKELTMNIITSDFIMTSLFLQDPRVIAARSIGNESGAAGVAQSFLQRIENFPSDIDIKKTTTIKYSIVNGTLIPATSLSNTQVIGVYFYQKDVNNLPIYYTNGGVSNIFILVASGESSPEVVAADFSHQYPLENSGTYPIKTSTEAFDELSAGKAYIARYDTKSDEIQIKKVYLGYFLSLRKQEYLMPIVIFEGDGFFAYLPSVRDEWIGN